MVLETPDQITQRNISSRSKRDFNAARNIFFTLLALLFLSSFFVIVSAGERGVWMRFGKVQEPVLDEGIHVIIPLVDTVQKLSVRVQSQEISAEASSKDLQEVYTDVALNWHINPPQANRVFQEVGDEQAIVLRIINPAVEEVLKAVMAKYTAEEIITRRGEVKSGVDELLTTRLKPYYIDVDDISLVHVHFTNRFSDAVEAKQIAEQDAKRAEFVALKASKEAEAKVNLARGEAEAQRLLKETLTSELLQKQAIDKWNGSLPLVMGNDTNKVLDINALLQQAADVSGSPRR
ncbi:MULTISPECIES: prohibitin family protein [unclassified Leptolyngbya]|uniref:prohibitin family protein n=1 Tax=unclassified Leptolyngbya TaxID=2650499 RepID=UPI001686BB51|nr:MULTISPECIES: prohibitin family protein [unclassified Leptolyngbya]MBD1909896.1 prohibitin family protein [Leptolyngbya sp. FACHB-8]MBD2158640.1 prohibitin family protein [Leptolyngbya sp. FACHB-16]